ncbi:Leucine-rich repeat receptor-like serine/threonine-protein kinase [Actinidia chinensis var. chinensis]|uniref:Leucine-rich repeat receptor-like serine/threonine-protein kinase n=1 Tax=Actinidia chinensis var. chinensis TaxID=1590841 RepID=A0A2R6PKV9_ACTCC|nr:Leucine-rich repeat receptor-like serine/threonine-protein kinase [Actinidia chinensis var. chinensis]
MPLLSLLFLLSLLSPALSQPPRATLIDCGATVSSVIDGRQWLLDADFVSVGTQKALTTPVLSPVLSTVRSFQVSGNLRRKFCYTVPAFRNGKYLIRTTYFYGGINGLDSPPVFDQIVDGTFWSMVNTTEDYFRGMSSYYEGVFVARGKSISVCVAANTYTDSDPFISALELVLLADSLYNSTDFGTYALSLVARHSFGYEGSIIRYPDDSFDRYWEPFGVNNSTIARGRNVSVSGFWNLPPLKVFQTGLTTAQPGPLNVYWPPASLPNSTYYIALYFADDRDSSSGNSSALTISINDVIYYRDLIVTPAGVMVFANQWLLFGPTNITLTLAAGSNTGPLINAGEVFDVLIVGGRTHTRDVIALEQVKKTFQNPPLDWNGDPCLPREYAWTGVTCSEGSRIRVVALNLTSMGLSGSLSPYLANLTAVTDIWLGNNSLSGTIPDLSLLKILKTLHLEDNKLTGEIPTSLGNIESLHELFLQGNNLTGPVPNNLMGKPGLNLKTAPGNQFLSRRPS